ncbi:unnamed protein product [Microthlaspi erraticum]|uniref:Uncharacterized protein n=1 Tax=Microthlaspi erraticum TaxID=1685480 RepID=A0A6D2KGN6_9BRAS|nr:unnamed protein product [Microthlaspi erraticum]
MSCREAATVNEIGDGIRRFYSRQSYWSAQNAVRDKISESHRRFFRSMTTTQLFCAVGSAGEDGVTVDCAGEGVGETGSEGDGKTGSEDADTKDDSDCSMDGPEDRVGPISGFKRTCGCSKVTGPGPTDLLLDGKKRSSSRNGLG